MVSPFGCANNGSNWINPGDVKIIFTFMGMTTSIVQVENGDKPRVYPNPAVGKLFIENVKEYIFYNPISQAVVSQQKNCNSRVEVSLENVPQGMYILKTDHGTEKVLVQ